ncbi:MAG: cyclase family protein [Kovacikia sp.]
MKLTPIAQLESDGYHLRQFSMGEYSGTHMNAPNSFFASAAGIDAYSPVSLVVPAVVIDVQQRAASEPDYSLTEQHILLWEQQYGAIPGGSVVLL